MTAKVRWGILGTGAIARTFARNLAGSETGVLTAVASRSQQSADAFGEEFHAAHRFGRYEDLLRDRDVEAIYIALPHTLHALWAIRAAEAGKHLLVEKPLAVNHPQAMAIVESAIANEVFLMEAFMYRCHPQTARLLQLIRDERAIGDVRLIHATFSFHTGFNDESRIFKNDLAGGGTLDVGCYTVSIARLIAGEPIDVSGTGHLGQTGVDEWAIASLRFRNDVIAQLSCGVSLGQDNVVRIFGSEGKIVLHNPWTADRNAAVAGNIIVERNGEPARTIDVAADRTAFAYEADVAGRAIRLGAKQAPAPAMTWDDSLGNMKTLDRWRDAIGLSYEFEQPSGFSRETASGRRLARATESRMPLARVAGIDKPLSRLVLGCDNQSSLPHAAVMFDEFFSRGGNAFDTAFIYGHGKQERLLGEWIKSRGVREQIVIIAKGGHSPYCNPIDVTMQLRQSLDRLQIDRAEMYLLHRDNPEIGVNEFIDVLNEHADAGRIGAFGASNWTSQRVDEANDYAQRTGKRGFAMLSNQFSLARMVEPIWPGCISVDDSMRAWLTKTQLPLLAWSSQARGFFVPGRADAQKRDDVELVRGFYSDDNFRRLDRANDLARRKNVSPIHIALAYVLHQPFPTFALTGPRELSELRTTCEGLEVSLSPEEMEWLSNS